MQSVRCNAYQETNPRHRFISQQAPMDTKQWTADSVWWKQLRRCLGTWRIDGVCGENLLFAENQSMRIITLTLLQLRVVAFPMPLWTAAIGCRVVVA